MNKKFSTLLTMGLLATSSLCGSAWAQVTINGIDLEKATDPNGSTVKTWAAGPYFVVVDEGDGSLGAGDILLKVTYNEGTQKLEYEGETLVAGDNTLDLGEVSWFLNEAVQTNPAGDKTYSYTLKNVGLETFVTFDENGTVIEDPNKVHIRLMLLIAYTSMQLLKQEQVQLVVMQISLLWRQTRKFVFSIPCQCNLFPIQGAFKRI